MGTGFICTYRHEMKTAMADCAEFVEEALCVQTLFSAWPEFSDWAATWHLSKRDPNCKLRAGFQFKAKQS
jgi:hypothetical protein